MIIVDLLDIVSEPYGTTNANGYETVTATAQPGFGVALPHPLPVHAVVTDNWLEFTPGVCDWT